jgi:3-hydroxy-9,10-secoandrosta-1,3,5(10)-triene-9,17-dione monooxygenase
MREVMERIEKMADFLREQSPESERLGKLTDATAQRLRESGVIRLLQPKEFGGYEAHPAEFFEAVLKVGSFCGSAGWVAGVVGVHPWQLGQLPIEVQRELWGDDPDTWIASPYAPFGRARPVEGGYLFSGRWPFSSGTDHCDWVILGGLVTDENGEVDRRPGNERHFLLPRGDYTIHHDSWEVLGLKGTGSKDVSVKDVFVPEYRVIDPKGFADGTQARSVGRDNPIYHVPFGSIFPAAISCATLAMAEGALAAYVELTRGRVTVIGNVTKTDPHHLRELGEASADIEIGRRVFIDDWKRMVDAAAKGRVPDALRLETRRNQVRAVRRAVDAVDRLFAIAGGNSLRLDQPLQRFWRDLHAGMNHICNVAEPVYDSYGKHTFGLEPNPRGW